MHKDKYTLCYLKFEDFYNPWKDECGNIFEAYPNDYNTYPERNRQYHVNGRGSYCIKNESYIECEDLNFDLNELEEWTIDFWIYIPETIEDAADLDLFYIYLFGKAIKIETTTTTLKFIEGRRNIQSVTYENMTGSFIHNAIVKNKTSVTSYWNGEKISSTSIGTSPDDPQNLLLSYKTRDLVIGGDRDIEDEDYYCCYIDDFRISSIARYPDNYRPEYELDREHDVLRLVNSNNNPYDPTIRTVLKTIELQPFPTERYIKHIITRNTDTIYNSTVDLHNEDTKRKGEYTDTFYTLLNSNYSKKGIKFDTYMKNIIGSYNIPEGDPRYDPSKDKRPKAPTIRNITKTYKYLDPLVYISCASKYSKDGIKFDTYMKNIIGSYNIPEGDPRYDPSKDKRPKAPTIRKISKKFKVLHDIYFKIVNIRDTKSYYDTKYILKFDSIDKNGKNKLPKLDTERRYNIDKYVVKFDTHAYHGDNIKLIQSNDLVFISNVRLDKRKAYSRPIYRYIYCRKNFKTDTLRDVQNDKIMYDRDYNMGRNTVAFVFNTEYSLRPEYEYIPYFVPKSEDE